jgi:hemoglobin/transferrin/lactoferrin receptor protein
MLDKRTVKIAAAFVVSTFLSSAALAQVAVAPANNPVVKEGEATNANLTATEVTKFDTVTVVATKTPQSTFTFPGQAYVLDLSANPTTANSSRISNIQNKIPGLNFYGGPRSNGEVPQMRGFSQKGVIVSVDGKKQNFDAVHDGRFFIDPQLVKKVEVVKGPSSALYGSGGLGGVVAFETKDAVDVVKKGQIVGGESSVGFNSANMEVQTSHIAGMVQDNVDALAAVTLTRGDDVRLGGGATVKDDNRVINGLAKVTYAFNEATSLKVDASTYQGEAQNPNNPQAGPNDTSAVNKVDRSNIVNSVGAKLNFNPSNLVDLTTHAYFTNTSVEERVLQGTALNPADSVLENEISTIGLTIDNRSKVENVIGANHTFTYGVEYINNDMTGSDSTRAFRWGVPSAESTQMGAFIQDELKFAGWTGEDSSFYIVPGARFDKFENEAEDPTLPDQSKSNLSPKLAATYEFNKNYNVFASWAEAFRAPTMTELYIAGSHFPAGFIPPSTIVYNTFLPNPNLKPETAQTFEYGFGVSFDNVAQASDKVKLKVSRFETKADDYIDQFITFNPGTGGNTGFVNVDEAKIWGYEANVDYLSDFFRANVNLGWFKGKDANTGANLGTNDALKVNADVAFTIPNTSTELGYMGKYAAGFNDVNPRNPAFGGLDAVNFARGGYAVHGVYTRHTGEGKFDGFVFDLGLDNILDKRYANPQARNYEIGRSLFTRVTYKW